MAQNLVASLWAALKSAVANVLSTAPLWLAAILILGGLWIALLRLAPERADALLLRWREYRSRVLAFGATVLAVTIGALLLVLASRAAETRDATSRGATASRRRDPYHAPVDQFAPSHGIVRERTYTRTLQLPPTSSPASGAKASASSRRI